MKNRVKFVQRKRSGRESYIEQNEIDMLEKLD